MQADSSVLPSSVSSVPRNKPSNIGLSANFLRKARFFAFDSSVLLISHIAHDILFGTPHLAPVRILFVGLPPCTPVLFAGLPPCTRFSLQGSPPCNPAPPFEKGGDPKTFSADKQHPFNERVKNPECRSRRFSGAAVYGRRSLSLF